MKRERSEADNSAQNPEPQPYILALLHEEE